MEQAVVITGGGQRVGLALALALKQQGYEVIVSYRSDKPGVQQLKQAGVITLQADFSEQAGIEQFINELDACCSSVRALIHNASDWLPESKASSPAVAMAQMMQIHAMVPYQLNLAFAEKLKLKGPGDIIHMSDYVVKTGSQKHIAYAASKAALQNMTLSFASLLAPQIKVNTIAPGLIMFNQHDDEAYRQKAKAKSLLQIEPGAEVIIETVNYILTNRYLTGSCIDLDGGRSLAR
ncbi:dihydromonapterin reductase [Neiella marina]|uniref:Dihydromonapterin reductase n=1 Tax=Neiella holothuriorum TaxID=2870530 RepID=A0ABS7EEV6_9GAMM|nr:dihydromonapterin reductase [Neiella holothuriorum]